MSWLSTLSRTLAASVMLGASSSPLMASVVFGNWEGSTAEGWFDWNDGAFVSPKWEYGTIGATNGSTSLKLTRPGWEQTLSIKLHENGLVDDFLANQKFSIDITVPATTFDGYSKIEGLVINAQGYGFTSQPGSHLFGWGPGGGGAQTVTMSWDYSALIDGDPGNGEITATPSSGYIELMLTTNSDANHGIFYFDNARFDVVPEPAAAAIAVVAMGLLGRRRMA